MRVLHSNILVAAMIALAAVCFAGRWALLQFLSPPQGIHPTSWTYADLIRDRYPFHFVDPSWVADDMYWGFTESVVRLSLVLVVAAALIFCFIRFRRHESSRA
jgi:hypothetical protein